MGKDARREYLQRLEQFVALWTQLRDWYSDGGQMRTNWMSANGSTSDPSHGHVVLVAWRYPGPDWVKRWNAAKQDPAAQEEILKALEEELYGLDHGPSQSSPASGLHHGTREWRLAVANADGSLRAVARRFGVSHTEVQRLRLQHREPA